ncbi:transmembrane protein 186 isoform X1 [Ranitomeya imitator]|uniref:transmembrane protein 186 isoform X1 n=2 Tax=Ranitomeya imitator TaxID=111125 RepID=UPI0037E85751
MSAAGYISMAQLIIRSWCFRPSCQPLSVQLWKSNVPCRTSFIGCGRITHPSRTEVSQLLSSTNKKWIETSSLFRTASPLSTKTDDSTKFTLIYKFPGIRYCRVVSRMKLLQTTLTILVLPPVYYFYLQGQLSQFAAVYCTGVTLFAGFMLYGMSYYLRRIIGMLYVDEDLKTVKVSYMTFWGNRRNILVPINDVKQLSETGDNKGEILRQFARYSDPHILYFTTRYGLVLDREKFAAVFGE